MSPVIEGGTGGRGASAAGHGMGLHDLGPCLSSFYSGGLAVITLRQMCQTPSLETLVHRLAVRRHHVWVRASEGQVRDPQAV